MNRNAHHDLVMEEFYSAREAWEQERELIAMDYKVEMREYAETNPCPRFKDFLILHSNKSKGI